MSGKIQKPQPKTDNSSPKSELIQDVKRWELSCACCNQDIIGNNFIGIVHYGTMIHLCGEPCGIRDYLETQ